MGLALTMISPLLIAENTAIASTQVINSYLPKISAIRNQAIVESATSASLSKATYDTYQSLVTRLKKPDIHSLLNQTFDFSLVTTSDRRILYPAVTRVGESVSIINHDTLGRIRNESQAVLSIIRPAKILIGMPSWRDYLLKDYKPVVTQLHRALMPKTKAEKNLWETSYSQAWSDGIQNAHRLFERNLANLERDFRGGLLYRQLVNNRMIEEPKISKTKHGIVINGNTLSIDQRTIAITTSSKWIQAGKWKPIIVQ